MILRHSLQLTLFAALAALPGSTPAPAALWYDLGHRVVADIAERRLTPEAARAVRNILGGQRLSDASVWADNIKQYRHDADPLHYVNIPLGATAYDAKRDCPHGKCIIAAIASDRQVLANPAASMLDRAEALRFLIHFIGDLHQPLHVADNGDRGGNRRVVYLEGDSMNLHQVWDGELFNRYGLSEETYLAELQREMDTMDLAALERGTVVDWAMEGHRVAIQHAYRVPAGGRLGVAYVEANRPIVDHALIAAGVRLAKVLNEALAGYRPSPQPAADLGPGVYPDREAAAHVGETATIVGTVVSVFRSPGGNVYLNFGADYPRQTFTAVALAPVPRWTTGVDSLVGRRVRVRGKVVNYRGRVEIVLKEAEQISLDSSPTTSPPRDANGSPVHR
jgi:nuclease S1